MQYQYRWWYAALLSLAIFTGGFIYLLKPSLSRLHQLQVSFDELSKKIAQVPPMPRQKEVKDLALTANKIAASANVMTSSAPIDQLFALANLHGLSFAYADKKAGLPAAQLSARVIVKGNFQQLNAFLEELFQQKKPWTIKNFIYEIKKDNQLNLTMDLLSIDLLAAGVKQIHEKNNTEASLPIKNPFCHGMDMTKENQRIDEKEMAATAIDQLKMIGVLRQGTHQQALILLPNGSVVTAEIGMLVGKERGIVADISDDKLTINLNNNQPFILHLNAYSGLKNDVPIQ